MNITRKYSGGITAIALLATCASLVGQQPTPHVTYLNDDFSTISDDWVPDRNEPSAFSTQDGVLQITVNESTSAENRPSGRSGQFYDTQGYKRFITDNDELPVSVEKHDGSLVVTAQLWIPEEADTQPMRSDIWTRFVASADDIEESNLGVPDYAIIGFANFDGVDQPLRPRFQVWNTTEWLEVAVPVETGEWARLTVVANGAAVRYYVNGQQVYAMQTESDLWFTSVILQAYNYTSDRFNPEGAPGWSNDAYSASWEDLEIYTTQDDVNSGDVYAGGSIQAAIDSAFPGDTIRVHTGTYIENIVINKAVSLVGENAEIVPANEQQNTVVVNANLTGVSIEGFTIHGVDGASPGIEKSSIYVIGAQTDLLIQGNTIIADGEAALVFEYNAVLDGLDIIGNTFSGKTFQGDNPASGNQFTVPNVARQLVVIQSADNGTSVRFENNIASGVAAGVNGNGNTLVTIDIADGEIRNNRFDGTTSGALLRARRGSTAISGNTFNPENLVGSGYILLLSSEVIGGGSLESILAANTIEGGYAIVDEEFSSIGGGASGGYYVDASLSVAVSRASSGSSISASGDFLENVSIPAGKTVHLIGENARLTGTGGANTAAIFIRSDNSSVEGFTINKAETGYAAILLAGGTSGVGIYNNKFSFAGPAIETQGSNTSDLDIVENTFVASLNSGGLARGIYVNGGYTGPGALAGPASGINIAGNTFQGEYGLGSIVGIEGAGQVSVNDFTGVGSASVYVGVQVGPIVVDGNCFPETEELLLGGSAGSIAAEYNYFGRAGGAVASNYEGDVDVSPHLLSCDDYFLVEAEQATGGVITPAFAYTNSSATPTFTFSAASGFAFSGAYLNGAPVAANGDTYTVTGITDHSIISAEFTATASMITSGITSGAGTLMPQGTVTVAHGGSQSFTILPASGFKVDQVLYNGVDMASSVSGNSITIAGVTGANTLEVSFTPVASSFPVTFSKIGSFVNYLSVTAVDASNGDPVDLNTVDTGTVLELQFNFTALANLLKVKSVTFTGGDSGPLSVSDGGSYTLTSPISGMTHITINVGL